MFKKSLVMMALCGASFAASAVTVDLRHEFIDGGKTDKTNADRVSVSHRFANGFGFSVEAKWKSGGDNTDKPYADFIGNGHEESISYQYKFNKNFSVQPGFNIESNDSRSIYKPNLRVQYSFDNGFYVAARYRYDYTRYPSNANKDDDKVNRGDAWAGYVFGDWRTELNYVYARSTEGNARNNNKPYSQEYNVKVAYKIDKNWAPYGEVGNVGVNDRDDRQTRFRVGVAYSF
ncbi:MAG: oligogalacturonate-specific porin KdgM family protein [Kluyvera cryocrescens]|uniref:Oligogalacturonate-specific porin KdgM family protein n=1 Tax=Kluyvera cryocrescens TaxID=580 RepID=A0AAW9C4C3_KLUCR|nr:MULTISPECIES: oligogalacturonate-specific porin KdgM family protein [Kluyvera]MCX2867088.1 porin [Kluyvera cryocrescens]MDU5684305.1 oligogalacturonate-specific porin KdgM family protein [Kluyvera cryocrescens]MDW3776472.1 oligogalacturonate-specific porin KdgM family protein [Kluyvera cryocrescens]MEB6634002.1 oligogalacturonate-specific porin KdgM family protein [Kluyvera cryocrescens]MEB7556200.1 oligogalacturonate-specific porin KdgM family protein [Kluyvera cryocrescens]